MPFFENNDDDSRSDLTREIILYYTSEDGCFYGTTILDMYELIISSISITDSFEKKKITWDYVLWVLRIVSLLMMINQNINFSDVVEKIVDITPKENKIYDFIEQHYTIDYLRKIDKIESKKVFENIKSCIDKRWNISSFTK